jgi:hypothetical protein
VTRMARWSKGAVKLDAKQILRPREAVRQHSMLITPGSGDQISVDVPERVKPTHHAHRFHSLAATLIKPVSCSGWTILNASLICLVAGSGQ